MKSGALLVVCGIMNNLSFIRQRVIQAKPLQGN